MVTFQRAQIMECEFSKYGETLNSTQLISTLISHAALLSMRYHFIINFSQSEYLNQSCDHTLSHVIELYPPLPAGSCHILEARPAEYQGGRSIQAQQTALGSALEPSVGRGHVLTTVSTP